MTRGLVVVFLTVEALDLALYAQAPHFESGPMAAVPPTVVAIAKVAAILLVVLLARALSRGGATLVLAVGIAIGAFGAGTSAATLSIARAAEAPRSAPEPAPIAPKATGIEQGARSPAAPERTPAPGSMWARQAPARLVPAAIAAPATLRGLASWYAAAGPAAAAGPELRRALGPHWRGKVVTVCVGTCIPVKLVDWCQCYRGQDRERLVDLGLEAFARLERPSAGLLRVTIVLGPPATDVPRGTVP